MFKSYQIEPIDYQLVKLQTKHIIYKNIWPMIFIYCRHIQIKYKLINLLLGQEFLLLYLQPMLVIYLKQAYLFVYLYIVPDKVREIYFNGLYSC